MSVNSSNSSSLDSVLSECFTSAAAILTNTVFHVTKAVLLFPLSVFVLHLGHQRWRQQQRSFASTSHSDVFTYHVAVMGLIWGLGSALVWCAVSSGLPEMITAGLFVSSIHFYEETAFHVLTCVERYLAVVHPVIYLGLKKARGIRIRNVSVGCVWLLSFVWIVVMASCPPALLIIPLFFPMVFSVVVVSFCSLSVLRVLIRPGPGDKGQDKERVDQSKQKAFITITAIMAVLMLWFGSVIVAYCLDSSPLLSPSVGCAIKMSSQWLSLPSSLVLPLLYLHRAGKLPRGCLNSE